MNQWTKFQDLAAQYAVPFLLRVVGALALWFVGRALIRGVVRMTSAAAGRRRLDVTIVHYAESIVSAALTVVLAIAVLGVFGIETTTFAAAFAAVGLAIGMAWGGLLSNFAAGAFLLLFGTLKVGQHVEVSGTSGVVSSIGLFSSVIERADGVRVTLGNGKIFGDAIKVTPDGPRVINVPVNLLPGVDVALFIDSLEHELAEVPDVLSRPTAAATAFPATGPVVTATVICPVEHVLAVEAATCSAVVRALGTQRAIRSMETSGGYPAMRAG